jgi:hypothetical protein
VVYRRIQISLLLNVPQPLLSNHFVEVFIGRLLFIPPLVCHTFNSVVICYMFMMILSGNIIDR